jgi:glycosyltransferase involved in cell wall biosynthesis
MSIIKMAPENVVFTDFLSDEIFNALLKGGDIILSLTKADLTMQNGVYEAIALGRPVITSDWPVLRKTYRKGVICTDNSSEALFNAIQEMKQNYHFYLREINELRTEFLSSWQEKRAQLIELLNGRNH